MINILLIGKDINYCIKLLNNINKLNSNIKVIGILDNKNEFKNFISELHIDIIIIIDNEKYLYEKFFKNVKYYNKIIYIIDRNTTKNNELKSNEYLIKYKNITKTSVLLNKLIIYKSKVNLINRKDEQIIKNAIIKELKYLNYNMNHKGTKYLIETIYILYCMVEFYYDYNLKRDIYPLIAEKYNKSVNNIKTNINNATNSMYLNCEKTKLKNYLKIDDNVDITNRNIIIAILNRINQIKN